MTYYPIMSGVQGRLTPYAAILMRTQLWISVLSEVIARLYNTGPTLKFMHRLQGLP